ncbi:diablo, IAP-binding mitochondrial protein a isoform X2 [Amia ocellicauda]|uniref:diablo, IAP-binding mitochondrial protein a isoform X2 n=1 Tax=Amia ocellicauda TaxID=2972642 RepID=UPI003463A2D2
MAAFRRGVMSIGLFRCSWSVIIASRQRLARFPVLVKSNCLSFGAGGGLCAVPFSQHAESLSHETLIKRASSLVTDGANTYLSQTTLALVDALTQYAKAVHTLIALQKRYNSAIGKLTPAEEDAIWQVIIGARVEMNDKLDNCKRFQSNWMNAVNLSELAAEAAYNAGADQASVTARTNIQLAQAQVEDVRRLSLEAEMKLAEVKVEEIKRTAEYATSEKAGEDVIVEEEVPDAYLRED